MVRLPDFDRAPGFRSGLTSLANFRVQDFGEAVLVEPAEGAGTVRRHMTLHRLCDAGSDLSDDATWTALSEHPSLGSVPSDRRQRLMEHAGKLAGRDDFPAQLEGVAALVAAVEPEELPDLLRQQLPALFRLLPHASVWWLAVDPVLVRRYAILRALLALELTPDINTDPEEFEGLRLLSSHSLTSGLDFGKSVDAALLAFSPGVTGFSASKLPNALVVLFGDPLELRVEPPAQFSSLYEPRVLSRAATWNDLRFRRAIGVSEAEGVLRWWIDGLNVIYSYATDPTGFSDPLGRHDAAAQTAWMLTWERLLADGITVASGVNLPTATRMELSFDLLDKAEQLLGYLRAENRSGKGFKLLLRRGEAVPALNASWSGLPEVLRARFEKHTRKVYETLYADLRKHTLQHRLTQRGVKVAMDAPDNLVTVGTEQYAADLLRDIRNSAHGFVEQLQGEEGFLIATHDGTIPTQLADVGRLVMLAFGGGAERLVAGTWLQADVS
jgi:hypothetical protein